MKPARVITELKKYLQTHLELLAKEVGGRDWSEWKEAAHSAYAGVYAKIEELELEADNG